MFQNNLENWTANHQPYVFSRPNINSPEMQKQRPILPQFERHLVKVQLSEVESYCMMLQGRLNNKNTYITNIVSFQILPQKQALFLNSKQIVEILVCTDKMVPLADHDWTKDNLVKILLGLKRLAMIYGPFDVKVQQICKNEVGEIKVWISQMPEKCRVDSPLPSEKDMLRNIALIVQKKNSEFAFRINATRTIRQAIDSLNSIFVYNSPQKQNKTMDWADFHLNKNIFSSCTTKFDANKTINSPPTKNQSFAKNFQFPQSAKNQNRDKIFFPNNFSTFDFNNISRPQSKVSNPLYQQGLIRSEQYNLKNNFSSIPNDSKIFYYIPNASHEPSRSNSRHLTFTPLNRFGNSSTGEHFSQRLGSQRAAENEGQNNNRINNFDITIINNNYSNYINNFAQNKSRKGSKSPINKYPSFVNSKQEKAKSQGKPGKNTSFWLNSGKLSKNKSTVPYFFAQKKKPQSSHQQYTLDSMEDSLPEFKRNDAKNIKVETCESVESGRKNKKLYTFFNPNLKKQKKQIIVTPTASQTSNKPNFFKKMTPSNSYNRSNTTQFFPSKKANLNNKTTDVWQDEGRQKCFNSCAVDMQYEQQLSSLIPTTKSVGIQQHSSTSSKKLQLKKQLKAQFGNLFNIAQNNQSPRCSYSEKMNPSEIPASQSKTELLKESILKEKIKQKNEAFAQLKKQALKVLTDF